jgi:multidrug efflux pump subunit AcrA (membrane-fusion protein)
MRYVAVLSIVLVTAVAIACAQQATKPAEPKSRPATAARAPKTSQAVVPTNLQSPAAPASLAPTPSEPIAASPAEQSPAPAPVAETATGSFGSGLPGTVTSRGCMVTPIDDIDVAPNFSAQESGGLIMEIKVKEGDQVNENDLVAQLDDSKMKSVENVSLYRLKQAEKEADNDINVRYATAAEEVSRAELTRAEESNKRQRNTVPMADLQRIWLQVKQATLGIEQAKHELGLAAETVNVRDAELKDAQNDVARRQVKSPISGMVVKKFKNDGEWVQTGEPVVRIVRLDRLWVEGWLDATQVAPHEVVGKAVKVTVQLARGRTESFDGKIAFASPEVRQDSTFQVKAEVTNRQDNGNWLLLPGYEPQMVVQLQ